MNDKPIVFISYRQKVSGSAARYINDRLEAMGLKVFFDADAIHLGDNWRASLEQNLLESQYLIVILAPSTLESEWVRREVEFALRHGKSVIPIFSDGLSNLYDVDFSQFPEQIAALRDIQGIEYNYKRPQSTFDELAQALKVNHPTAPVPLPFSPNPPPVRASQRPQQTLVDKPLSKRLPIRGLISAAIVMLGLAFAFLALFPEQTRTDWFRSIGLLPSLTPIASPTRLPPTFTATPIAVAQAATEIPGDSATKNAIVNQMSDSMNEQVSTLSALNAPSANSAFASVENTPPTTVPLPSSLAPSDTKVATQLHIFATRESLTLYVSQTVQLTGFQFGVSVDGSLKLKTLSDSFDSLNLTGGVANTNDCYIYQTEGTTPPLSQSCKGRIFRVTVAPADVFWYDVVKNKPRDLAIFNDGQRTGIICSGIAPDCEVEWDKTVAN